ncbi:MAG: ROK family protein [Propionicimonas sp.]
MTQTVPLSLGIDIGGTKAHGLVLDAADRVLAERVLPSAPTPAGVRRTVLAMARALAGELGLTTDSFGSIGLGIPGLVDPVRGVVETAVNLGIARCELADLLAGDFAVGVRVENDLKATALGAALLLGRPASDLAHLNLGTGLSAAAVSDGRLVRGLRNGAGELGHLAIDPAGERCRCGQRGCLETVLGGFHLGPRLAAQGLDLAGLGTDPRPAAAAERDRIVGGLATALTLLVIAYDSAAITLGGGVVRAATWLRPAAVDELRRRAADSPFLTGLAIAERLMELPAAAPVAPLGAALVGRNLTTAAVRSLED